MKNIFKYLFGLVALAMFAACTPETFEGANGQIPTLDGIEPVVSVDQNLNQVTFSLPDNVKGCMPVWILYDENDKVVYSTVNGLKKIYTLAGTYRGEFKLMNRNGISDGSKEFTFTMDNSIVNYDKYLTLLCGAKENSSKEWRIDNDKAGHLGCGQPATTGLDWWSAGANEKEGYGVYDCRLTFSADYKYNFNPGESGQIYVNKDVVALGGPQGEDFCVDATEQTVDYKFETKGNDLYIVFPQHTFFPYIANDDIWNEPRYKVESITSSEINLVIDNGGIAWHYILTSGAAAVKFSGFKYDSEFNLWKPVDDNSAFTTHFWYAPNWNQIADPEFSKDGNAYTFHLPEATTDQWMAQCPLKPNEGVLHLSANATYDMSCIISSDADIKGVTVKLTDVNSGDNFVFAERVDVAAYEDKVFYVSGVNELSADCDCELFFDFGGNPANTTVTVKNIVIKDHANDDGTVLPSDEPGDQGGDTKPLDPNSPANLWTDYTLETWYSPGDWSGGLNPEIKVQSKNEYTVVVPEGVGGGEWQGQNKLTIAVPADASKKYDFGCAFYSSVDGVITVKLADANDDSNHAFFYENNVQVKAFEDVTFKQLGIATDGGNYEKVMLIIDYGRLPAGTEITAKNFVFQEHKLDPSEVSLTWDMPGNLWANANVNLGWWYSAGDWSGALTPDINDSKAPREYVVTIPAGIGGSEWMGQTQFHTDIPASASKTYNFGLTFNSSEACTVTVKLAWEGNDNDHAFFYVNDVKLDAYTDFQFKQIGVAPDVDYDKVVLFVDLGRTPAGAEVTIKDFVLVEN